jgi:hypothetical protein
MAGETLALTDVDFYLAKQSAKSIAAAGPFLTASKFTQVNMQFDREVVDGVPGLASGLSAGQSIGLAYDVKGTANFQLNLSTMPTFLFDWFCTRVTTMATTLATHVWSGIRRNVLLPYGTGIFVYGEGATRGSGLVTRGVRDIRLTGLNFTISTDGFVEGQLSFIGLNWGPIAGTETFTAETTEAPPVPTPAAFFTMPSEWGLSGNLCTQSLGFTWKPVFVLAPGCYGTGEKADILLTSYSWDIDYKVRYDSVAIQAENYINTGAIDLSSATPYGAGKAGIPKGTLAFGIGTLENIGASSPLNVPYQFQGSIPMQWKQANPGSGQTPVTMNLLGSTIDYNWALTVKNDKNAAAMAW